MSAILLLSAFLLLSAPESHQAVPRPPDVVDYMPPPPTLAGLWKSVPVVVRGTIEGKSAAGFDGDRPSAYTRNILRVHEVLKDDGSIEGSVIDVFVPGATVEVGGREMRWQPVPLTDTPVGTEVILFLARSAKLGGFVVAYGAAGAFIPSNTASATSGASVTSTENEMAIPEILRHYKEFGREKIQQGVLLDKLRELGKK
jgi:hypothetical protein